jgi:hypothetical protein
MSVLCIIKNAHHRQIQELCNGSTYKKGNIVDQTRFYRTRLDRIRKIIGLQKKNNQLGDNFLSRHF